MPVYKQKMVILQRGDDTQPETARFVRFSRTLELLSEKPTSSQGRTTQKIYAFEKSVKIIEEFARSGTFNFSDGSFQALDNTYEKLKELFPVSDESGVNDFLVPQI